jgi:hypothetical protein
VIECSRSAACMFLPISSTFILDVVLFNTCEMELVGIQLVYWTSFP